MDNKDKGLIPVSRAITLQEDALIRWVSTTATLIQSH